MVDQADRLGGKLRTGAIAGGPVETGAEAFLVHGPAGESSATRLARRVGLGDAGLYRGLLEGMGAGDNGAGAVLLALERHDFVELEARVGQLGVSGASQRTLTTLPQLRGIDGPDVTAG